MPHPNPDRLKPGVNVSENECCCDDVYGYLLDPSIYIPPNTYSTHERHYMDELTNPRLLTVDFGQARGRSNTGSLLGQFPDQFTNSVDLLDNGNLVVGSRMIYISGPSNDPEMANVGIYTPEGELVTRWLVPLKWDNNTDDTEEVTNVIAAKEESDKVYVSHSLGTATSSGGPLKKYNIDGTLLWTSSINSETEQAVNRRPLISFPGVIFTGTTGTTGITAYDGDTGAFISQTSGANSSDYSNKHCISPDGIHWACSGLSPDFSAPGGINNYNWRLSHFERMDFQNSTRIARNLRCGTDTGNTAGINAMVITDSGDIYIAIALTSLSVPKLTKWNADCEMQWMIAWNGDGANGAYIVNDRIYWTGTSYVTCTDMDGSILWRRQRGDTIKQSLISPDGQSLYLSGKRVDVDILTP